MTLDDMARRMRNAELVRWRAFFALYPFGETGQWLRAGVQAAAAASAFGGRAEPASFLLPLPGTRRPGRKRPQLDLEQSDGLLKGIAERARKGKRGQGQGRGGAGGTIQGG